VGYDRRDRRGGAYYRERGRKHHMDVAATPGTAGDAAQEPA